MKNLQKIGHSIATGAGAALLASFASLFAGGSEAHAFNLIRENGDTGAVTRIEGLSVFSEGEETIYDVDFLSGSAVDVYGEDLLLDFDSESAAVAAAQAVMGALGTEEWLHSDAGGNYDGFDIAYGDIMGLSGSRRVKSKYDIHFTKLDYVLDSIIQVNYRLNTSKWAKFTATEPEGGKTVKTPEPNLIFGFITLGGLMLGSKVKNKG